MNNDFLAESVFPVLNAAESGLLNHLNPKNKGSYYQLDCPICSKPRAFYKTGMPVICNRKNTCIEGAAGVSVWSILASQGYSKQEIFKKLCDAVGVAPPNDENWVPSASSIFKKITKELFQNNNELIQSILARRCLSFEEAELMELGFYPNPSELKRLMLNQNCKLQEAIDDGFLPGKTKGHNNNAFQMENRIIGYWKQESGNYGYWGYSPTEKPKYLFSNGLDKSIPYKYRAVPKIYGCEGTFDSESIARLNYPSCALGQASISDSQCEYIKKHGTVEFIHLIDCDIAGIIGGIRTIVNCFYHGIKPFICFTGWMTDDADNLRKTGDNQTLINALDNPIYGPVFLTMVFSSSMKGDLPGHLLSNVDKAVKALPKPAQDQYIEGKCLIGYGAPTLSDRIHKLAVDIDNPHIPEKTHTMTIKQVLEDLRNE